MAMEGGGGAGGGGDPPDPATIEKMLKEAASKMAAHAGGPLKPPPQQAKSSSSTGSQDKATAHGPEARPFPAVDWDAWGDVKVDTKIAGQDATALILATSDLFSAASSELGFLPYTTVQVNHREGGGSDDPFHVDGDNLGPSFIAGLGDADDIATMTGLWQQLRVAAEDGQWWT